MRVLTRYLGTSGQVVEDGLVLDLDQDHDLRVEVLQGRCDSLQVRLVGRGGVHGLFDLGVAVVFVVEEVARVEVADAQRRAAARGVVVVAVAGRGAVVRGLELGGAARDQRARGHDPERKDPGSQSKERTHDPQSAPFLPWRNAKGRALAVAYDRVSPS